MGAVDKEPADGCDRLIDVNGVPYEHLASITRVKKSSGGPSPPERAVLKCFHAAVVCATLSVSGLRPATKSSKASAASAASATSMSAYPAKVV